MAVYTDSPVTMVTEMCDVVGERVSNFEHFSFFIKL